MSLRILGRAGVLALCVTWFASAAPSSPSGSVEIVSVAPGDRGEAAGLKPHDRVVSFTTAGAHGRIRTPFDLWRAEHDFAALRAVRLTVRRGERTLKITLPDAEWGLKVRPALDADRSARWDAALSAKDERLTEALSAALLEEGDLAGAAWLWLDRARKDVAGHAIPQADVALGHAGELASQVGPGLEGIVSFEAVLAFKDLDPRRAKEQAHRAIEAFAHAPAVRQLEAELWESRVLRAGGQLEPAHRELEQIQRALPRVVHRRLLEAQLLTAKGAQLFEEGKLDRAEASYRAALAVRTRRAPRSGDQASLYENLSMVLRLHSDFSGAEQLIEEAIALRTERNDPPYYRAQDENLLGVIARHTGRLDDALDHYRRARALFEEAGVRLAVAGMLNNLGNLSMHRGDLQEALADHQRALEIREKASPGSRWVAESLNGLGDVSRQLGRLDDAERYLTRALALKEKLAPHTLYWANTEMLLGEVALLRNDPAQALSRFQEVRTLRERFAPGSGDLAEAFDAEGRALEALGRLDLAREAYQRAVAAMELNRGRLEHSEDLRSAFASLYVDISQRLADLLVRQGRAKEAFEVLERSHARGLLALLAEKAMALQSELPPGLRAEEVANDAAYDEAEAALGRAAGKSEAEIRPLEERLADLRRDRARIDAEIHARLPKLAALDAPKPLSVDEVQALLPDDTALLAISVGARRSLLFTISASGLSVHPLEVGRDALAERVNAFRGFLERGRTHPDPEAPLLAAASSLYQDLLAPAVEVAHVRRWILVPTGPLHLLPFAALLSSRSPRTYLAQAHPLTVVPSATVFAELLRRPPPKTRRVVLFGDPSHPPEPRLPESAREANAIGRLFPLSETYLGRAATEAKVRERARHARYLHFATHAKLDASHALDSSLLLATPARESAIDNGMLQAWEVFEHLGLDASLVTLSGCDTGLGTVLEGEGLYGFTRAFEYAGARSVLVSKWAVPDRATSRLMERFYAGLKAGLAKDAALADAETQLREDPAYRHPYFWAAFELSGDPRPDRW
jgi:CHAT domain-containing protein/Tfp pilus assembly protein PilF